MRTNICSACREGAKLIGVGPDSNGVRLCHQCISAAYYLLRKARQTDLEALKGPTLKRDQAKTAVAAAVAAAKLGPHLFSWSGTTLNVLFRKGGTMEQFKLANGVSNYRVEDACRAIMRAAQSIPQHAE